jgi:hypothetical protein
MLDPKRREFIALVGGGGLLLAAKVKRVRAAAGDAGHRVSPPLHRLKPPRTASPHSARA